MQGDQFPTSCDAILERISKIRPERYAKTRNFVDGDVTYLSPYISRGVISTKQVMESVLEKGYSPHEIEKFFQELAWRDYWQQVWIAKGASINADLKRPQEDVIHSKIPSAVVSASTRIEAIDNAIEGLYSSGYMHNHIRMYVAAIACNFGKSHWSLPAKWMYYHLLDGDWASNALSWQWVAGSNSGKKYIANQENINRYCKTSQRDTFLDASYEKITNLHLPDELAESQSIELESRLPGSTEVSIDPSLPTYVYNWYNLDPKWDSEVEANRVLLLEPSVFNTYPISDQSIEFMLKLSRNINGIQIFTGEFSDLQIISRDSQIHYKEHPLNACYVGIEHPRDWMFSVKGYFPSFFGFWKKCKKELYTSTKEHTT